MDLLAKRNDALPSTCSERYVTPHGSDVPLVPLCFALATPVCGCSVVDLGPSWAIPSASLRTFSMRSQALLVRKNLLCYKIGFCCQEIAQEKVSALFLRQRINCLLRIEDST